MLKILINALVCASFIGLSVPALASGGGSDRNVPEYNLSGNNLGLKSYDPVSYFPEGGGTPQVGTIEAEYGDVLYRFANETNMQTFFEHPEKYEPTYGGWCAFAMSQGQKVDIDPLLFRINGNRLHLFVHQQALDQWDAKASSLERRADVRWRRISGEKPRK